MKLGYIVNSSHPLLQTISAADIPLYKTKGNVLVVGFAFAETLYPNIDLADKMLESNVYYCFDAEEAEAKSAEQIENFLKHCSSLFTSSITIVKCKEYPMIDLDKETFICQGETFITLTQTNTVYYINKQIFTFFNGVPFDIQHYNFQKSYSWDSFIYFPAVLKALNVYKEERSLQSELQKVINVNVYFGALCLQWLQELKPFNLEQSNVRVWQRAYKIEEALSNIKIKVDSNKLKELAETETGKTFQTILDNVQDNYIVQKYKGTDKTTGRIYAFDSGFSLQSLSKVHRDIIVAEPNCVLFEFDYQYFEYTLLAQLTKLPIDDDPHIAISTLIFGEAKREIGKKINYGLLYGQSVDRLIDDLKSYPEVTINKKELKELLLERISPVLEFSSKLQKQLKEKGYIENYFDRNITPDKVYASMNNYIQSTAADFIIIKIEKIMNLLKSYPAQNRIVLQNHDSILLNLDSNSVNNDLALKIKNTLEEHESNLFAKTTFKYGTNWKTLKSL